jgi:hypothetical protein
VRPGFRWRGVCRSRYDPDRANPYERHFGPRLRRIWRQCSLVGTLSRSCRVRCPLPA